MGAPMHARPRPAAPPRRATQARQRPDLRVVAPRRRLRAGRTVVLGVTLAFLIAFALVVAQALLVQGQQRLDDLDGRIAESTRTQQELRLRVAELESPARVVEAAQRLGMVPPDDVTYLTPTPGAGLAPGPE